MNEHEFNSMVSGLIKEKKAKEKTLQKIEKKAQKTVKKVNKGLNVWLIIYGALALGYLLLK